jgi:hypothetical protein
MSIADSLNDGEVEKADIKMAVATWTALLSDQALIDGTCHPALCRVHMALPGGSHCRAQVLAAAQ